MFWGCYDEYFDLSFIIPPWFILVHIQRHIINIISFLLYYLLYTGNIFQFVCDSSSQQLYAQVLHNVFLYPLEILFIASLSHLTLATYSLCGLSWSYIPSSYYISKSVPFEESSNVGHSMYMPGSFINFNHYEVNIKDSALRRCGSDITTTMDRYYMGISCSNNFIYVLLFRTIEDVAASWGGFIRSNYLKGM